MIEALNLWFSYQDKDVLKGLNFKARRREVVVIMGRNGVGKTTLLLHLNGLLKPKRGEVRFDGIKINYDKKSLFELRKRVALVFQNPDDQIIAPTVWQEVLFGPVNIGLDESFAKEALKLVGLDRFEKRLCSQLSLGEKKKLSIASALAINPEFLLLDEPTASLDLFGFESVVKVVENLKNQGKGVVIATHDLDLASRVGDRFCYMEDGRVILENDEIDLDLARSIGVRTYEGYKARSNRSSFFKT